MTAPASKRPPFFCPRCGQKHRADLEPLRKRAGSALRTPCQKCAVALIVRLDEHGAPRCEVAPEAAVETPPTPETRAAEPERELAEGDRADRYTIRGVARRGATSTVYHAHDPKTKRAVAMKVLRADASPGARRRFLRQVEVQANIRHPSIMPVYDQGTLEDGRPWFTMEMLLHPVTLQDVLASRRDGTIQNDRRLARLGDLGTFVDEVLIPVAEGIYVANIENGVLHGDLQPGNVLIDGHTGRPYVTDFGYSEPVGTEGGRSQVTHALTPFLAPELARGQIHPRTDVWGLGALTHLLLAGESPLAGQGEALRRAAEAGRYRSLPEEVPPPLAAVVRKAMAYQPNDRYVNARQMGADLRSWRKGGRVRAVDEFGGTEAARVETRAAIRRHLKSALWVGAGLVVGLLVGSQVEIGSDGAASPRIESLNGAADRLEKQLDRLAGAVGRLTAAEQARVYEALDGRAASASRRLAALPPSEARRSAEDRLVFVTRRFAPPDLEIQGPEGLQLKATNTATGREHQLAPGRTTLPPGPYAVRDARGGAFRFPAVIPWSIRPRTAAEGREPDVVTWDVPGIVLDAPAGAALVLAGRIAPRSPPYGPAAPEVRVDAFLLARRPVSHADYQRFLVGLPDAAARRRHLPTEGFTWDERSGRATVVPGKDREPIRGVSSEDAVAYCAWRSKAESATGAKYRLPTAAEWMLAAGGAAVPSGLGALGSGPPENLRGIFGMLDAPPEIVRASVGAGFLLKGRQAEDLTREEAIQRVSPAEPGDRSTGAGFRWVRDMPAAQ